MDFFQVFVGDVGVDLGRRDGSVAEHRLDTPDVGTVDKEVGGETVAQGVWVDVLDDPGFLGVVLDQTLHAPGGESVAFARGIFAVHEAFLGIGDKECRIDIVTLVDVCLQRRFGIWRDKDDAELAAFAADAEFFFVEVDVFSVEADEFGYPQPGRKKEFENGPVPEEFDIRPAGGKHQTLHLREFQEINLAIRSFPDLDLFGSEGENVLFGQVLEECPQHDGLVGLGIFFQGAAAPVFFAVQIEAVFVYFISSDIGRGLEFAPGKKGAEHPIIALDRPPRAVHLDFEVLEKSSGVGLERRERIFVCWCVHSDGLHYATLELYHRPQIPHKLYSDIMLIISQKIEKFALFSLTPAGSWAILTFVKIRINSRWGFLLGFSENIPPTGFIN